MSMDESEESWTNYLARHWKGLVFAVGIIFYWACIASF